MIPDRTPSNALEWSVSDLAGALKRTLEDSFGYVRLRGEVTGYRGPHASGHAYFCLKDQGARLEAVIWKTAFSRLKIKPQEGLEMVATGRITTFPGKSTYQIVVDTLEPAGIGALMALLEERRRKLTAEGLFETARKRKLPFLPRVVGVVTSPTGAVIRDILHRLEDRFPRRVLVWPVRVQGETSAVEVAAAIRGFNALAPGGPIPRPDVLIVARGGGSLEDLWGFNEEIVVRAAVESAIPLVAAIGHETDWTLIDWAADVRAPTPTGAAEMVVPVRADLAAGVGDLARRHGEAALRGIERRRAELRSAARALPTPEALFAAKRQRLDLAAARLKPSLARNARDHEIAFRDACRRFERLSPANRLAALRGRLDAVGERPRQALGRRLERDESGLRQAAQRLLVARDGLLRAERLRVGQGRERLAGLADRSRRGLAGLIGRQRTRLEALDALLNGLSHKAILARGFAIVLDEERRPVRTAAAVAAGQALTVEFADGAVQATAEGATQPARPERPARPARTARSKSGAAAPGALPQEASQGSLFGDMASCRTE